MARINKHLSLEDVKKEAELAFQNYDFKELEAVVEQLREKYEREKYAHKCPLTRSIGMATEQEYDERIAPMLLKVQSECMALGMAMVARVEWGAEGNAAIVTAHQEGQSEGQWCAWRAATDHGAGGSILLRKE